MANSVEITWYGHGTWGHTLPDGRMVPWSTRGCPARRSPTRCATRRGSTSCS